MKVLGMNSNVEVNGVPAKVTGITSKHLTLEGRGNDTVKIRLEEVNQMIDEKTLVVVKPS